MPMLFTRKPYDNNDVRLGLKYALDREEQVKKVLKGYGSVGNDHPIAPLLKYYAADLDLDGGRGHERWWFKS